MRKVKLFKGLEDALPSLEQEVNGWVEQSGAQIVSVTGNIAPQTPSSLQRTGLSPSDVFLVVLYEPGGE